MSEQRTPPHNLDAEASVLGAMLLSPGAIQAARAVTRVEHFYKPDHATVFAAICAVADRGEPADHVTVADQLSTDGRLEAIGGHGALVDLESHTPAPGNAAYYARIVAARAAHRALIVLGNDIAELGWAGPQVLDVDDHVGRLRTLAERLAAIGAAHGRLAQRAADAAGAQRGDRAA